MKKASIEIRKIPKAQAKKEILDYLKNTRNLMQATYQKHLDGS